MCGIFFSLTYNKFAAPHTSTENLLRNRGPDSQGIHRVHLRPDHDDEGTQSNGLHATFMSTVLSLRGTSVTKQPLQDDDSGSILCWNGEAWSIAGQVIDGNDSQAVLDALLSSSTPDLDLSIDQMVARVISTLSTIRGPFAFVFYDARSRHVFYGRDCLGRRSLLKKHTSNNELTLTSVCDNVNGDSWSEVEADGIYAVTLNGTPSQSPLSVTHIPHRRLGDDPIDDITFDVPFPTINQSLDEVLRSSYSDALRELRESLIESIKLRIQHVREATDIEYPNSSTTGARIAVLFSGGVDCTLLARLIHEVLSPEESVDLLNVAFENPRVHGNLGPNISPYELCPDRITGRASYAELVQTCPSRSWRFVEINVPYTDTVKYRRKVMTLMYPHNTEMDLSISYALYFASRGQGIIRDSIGASIPYTTDAHVLLSGLGADELFGGYGRHAVAFSRLGYSGLIEELRLDFDRLGKRNLGRDDRVISDSGKEVRFPFLDEEFIAFALQLPVRAKCDFGSPQSETSDDPAQFLEPAKRILRLLAWELGMKGVAAEKKRAIQFGARTAKMVTGKTKGTQVLT